MPIRFPSSAPSRAENSEPWRPAGGCRLREATGWDQLVTEVGLGDLARHGYGTRHSPGWPIRASTSNNLQRVDQDLTSRYLHPDVQAMLDAGAAFSLLWSGTGSNDPGLDGLTSGSISAICMT